MMIIIINDMFWLLNYVYVPLLRYSITKKRAQNLELYRTNNGLYKSLEDLLQIKGINNKCLYKFYKSIIYNNKRNRKVTRNLILTAKINDNMVQEHMVQERKLSILNILNENYNMRLIIYSYIFYFTRFIMLVSIQNIGCQYSIRHTCRTWLDKLVTIEPWLRSIAMELQVFFTRWIKNWL